MTVSARIAVAAVMLTTATSVAFAQFGSGGSLHGTSITAGVNSPLSDFARTVQSGFGVSVNTGVGNPGEAWSGRGSFGFDRFSGKGALNNLQFISYGGDVVHNSTGVWYQFAGLAINSTSYDFKTTADAGAAGARNGQTFGLRGGIGVNFGSTEGAHAVLEFSAATVFTTSKNSTWFPVRFGLQF